MPAAAGSGASKAGEQPLVDAACYMCSAVLSWCCLISTLPVLYVLPSLRAARWRGQQGCLGGGFQQGNVHYLTAAPAWFGLHGAIYIGPEQ